MTINLADNNPRIAYALAQGVSQSAFSVPFEFFDDTDLRVYVDATLKTQGSHYSVSGGDGSTGTITFSPALTGATGGSQIVILRNIAIERTTDFSPGADINRAALNEQFDTVVAMMADMKSRVDRSPTLLESEVVDYTLTLPSLSERASKYLAFGVDGSLVAVSGTTSTIIVSSFGESLIDDADAPAALQTLGLTITAAELNGLTGITASISELNILDGVTASTAELNILDGVTASTAEINILDGVTATTAEINILDGVTATTAEINILDGVTATTAELNYVDGVTSPIQTQLDSLASAASTVLLGTVNTTSGSVQTLSGLDLTAYKQVQAWVVSVDPSTTATAGQLQVGGVDVGAAGTSSIRGFALFDLGVGRAMVFVAEADEVDSRTHTLTTASTSISVTTTQTFASGSVTFYGVK